MSYKYLSGLSDNTSVPTGTLPITVSSNNVIGISATPTFGTPTVGGMYVQGLSFASPRPALTGPIGPYEIRGADLNGIVGNMGFLRISAGGGTSPSLHQSYIDVSGYSDVGDMHRSIVMGVAGTETLRLQSEGISVANTVLVGSTRGGNYLWQEKQAALNIIGKTNNGGNTICASEAILTMTRGGVSNESYQSSASFYLSRHSTSNAEPYSQFEIGLLNNWAGTAIDTNVKVLKMTSTQIVSLPTGDATSSTNGSFACLGGLSVGKSIYVGQNISCVALTQRSDIRLKSDIQTLTGSLDKVCKLQGVKYIYKETGRKHIGLIAQETEKVFPEFVDTNPTDSIKSIQYGNIVAVLIEAVKELSAQVKELQSR